MAQLLAGKRRTASVETLSSRTMSSRMIKFVQGVSLTSDELEILEATGLINMMRVSNIEPNMPQLTALAERWDHRTNTFHLPTGEITVTLEDVYRIMHVPICGYPVYQEHVDDDHARECAAWLTGSPRFDAVKMGCHLPMASNQSFKGIHKIRLIIAVIILCRVYPNKSGNIFPLRMVHIVQECVEKRRYAWGKLILARLYRDLHLFYVKKGKNIIHAPLLQIWALEHIKITRLPGTPYEGRKPHDISHNRYWWERWLPYNSRNVDRHDVEWWRNKFDVVANENIVWRPYQGWDGWDEDLQELVSVRSQQTLTLLCGHLPDEIYQPYRVPQQFESTQDGSDAAPGGTNGQVGDERLQGGSSWQGRSEDEEDVLSLVRETRFWNLQGGENVRDHISQRSGHYSEVMFTSATDSIEDFDASFFNQLQEPQMLHHEVGYFAG